MSHSIALPERHNLLNSRVNNSDKKKTRLIDHNGNEIIQDDIDQKKYDSYNNGGEQKTRSLPRHSKTNKMYASPFFHGNSRDQVDAREVERYDQYGDRKVDLKSDYQRNRYALG